MSRVPYLLIPRGGPLRFITSTAIDSWRCSLYGMAGTIILDPADRSSDTNQEASIEEVHTWYSTTTVGISISPINHGRRLLTPCRAQQIVEWHTCISGMIRLAGIASLCTTVCAWMRSSLSLFMIMEGCQDKVMVESSTFSNPNPSGQH